MLLSDLISSKFIVSFINLLNRPNFKFAFSLFQIIIFYLFVDSKRKKMPMSQNDLKFLKRRKYSKANSEKSNWRLEFDLESKKIFEAKEENFCHAVSEQNFPAESI